MARRSFNDVMRVDTAAFVTCHESGIKLRCLSLQAVAANGPVARPKTAAYGGTGAWRAFPGSGKTTRPGQSLVRPREHGIGISCRFSAEALGYVSRIDTRIILVDSVWFTRLMLAQRHRGDDCIDL